VDRYPGKVSSAVFIAPAGLTRSEKLDKRGREVVLGKNENEKSNKEQHLEEDRDWVFDFLEDGQLVLPFDWEERVRNGEIVAEAIRQWEYDTHPGYQGSVVGIVKDGGVFDHHEVLKRALTKKEREVRCLVVLGEKDGVVSAEECAEVGFDDVRVIKGVGHGVVREKADEVGGLIAAFLGGLYGNE
jgi:pimeloyl-ACP methyl ester carboxylesterase